MGAGGAGRAPGPRAPRAAPGAGVKGLGGGSTRGDAMDAAPGLLGAPPPEVLEDVLREQFGPLPQLAAVCRLKRLPAGGYSSTEDLQLVLERRRVANAKERERVSPALVPTATWVHPGTGTDAAPLPRVPAARLGTPAGARRRRPGPAGAPRPVARPPPLPTRRTGAGHGFGEA